jgi:hypothetical protein
MPTLKILGAAALLAIAMATPVTPAQLEHLCRPQAGTVSLFYFQQHKPQQRPQVRPLPSPQPGGGQQGAPQGYSNACYVSLNPVSGCYWSQYYPIHTQCGCEDANGNGYYGEFL